MTTRDTIDRRALLATGIVACSAAALGGCSDDASGGGTGGTGTGGAAGTGGVAGTGGSGAGTGPAGQAGSAGSPAGGTGASGMAGGGMGGAGIGGMGATAGTGGAAPPTMCVSDVSKAGTGMHTHPLTIPGSDVDQGYPSSDYYILEDGGTGHTHTILLSAYEFVDLQFGTPVMTESSTDMNHSHNCTITCTSS